MSNSVELTNVQINAIAEDLQGTCNSFHEVVQKHVGDDVDINDISVESLQEIDNLVLECEMCNWWCEAHEINDEGVCNDCA